MFSTTVESELITQYLCTGNPAHLSWESRSLFVCGYSGHYCLYVVILQALMTILYSIRLLSSVWKPVIRNKIQLETLFLKH